MVRQSGLRFSTRLFLIGLLLIGTGAGLFTWGLLSDLQPAQGLPASEPMRVIGQVAGGVGGVGMFVILLGLVRRLRGG